MKKICGICCLFLALVQLSFGQNKTAEIPIRAGVGTVDITPQMPFWLTGYAARKTPGTGVLHPIWAKALVIEQDANSRIIIVTVDVLGLSHEIVTDVFNAAHEKYGIRRSQLLLNSSHTHSGPMIWPCLEVIYDFSAEDQGRIAEYNQQLAKRIIAAIDTAMAGLAPARLYSGHGEAGFAINRRNDIHPNGPVDHDVPVLKVETIGKGMKAVLFGYACHNTTLVDDNFLVNGDYAGFAQKKLEADFPGVTAMFLMGCAGDQNPSPRGTAAIAGQHGNSLAAAVTKTLKGAMKPVLAPIRTDYNRVFLAFQPVDLKRYQEEIRSTDRFLQRRAKLMLDAYNKGWSVDKLSYPIQAVRFNKDFTILGLSDEVVVDYSLLYKKMFPEENLYVAGYCSDVQCYIPSKRILQEGGYEGNESMIYYGQPGPFAADVEDRVTKTVLQVMRNVGVEKITLPNEQPAAANLKGTLGTYAFPPLLPNGEVDGQKLVAQLKDIHANTYHWLAWGKQSDLAAFKKFIPLARNAGIKLWITLVPPSEAPPFARDFSEPYKLDYLKWAEELAKLSLQEPTLVAWSIDDFVHNLDLFTPAYMRKMIGKVRAINPKLAFIPCAYYEQVTPKFAVDYAEFMEGILFPYRNESIVANLDDASTAEAEITHIRALFAPGFMIFIDIYATGHSAYGESSAAYVEELIRAGRKSADGVMIYCHQDPAKYPEKYQVLRKGFAAKP
ncbi:neutral/alkaline non-lysosomal ceramidase N-terminal domain-containing protein [Flavihumibacter fluvii]|uniref:neutral/alkaline non-lysosomal ceramidase N-terminal domain-containing protein n=1 Tax=Flavihumibacter fluvii TaxID=2838157 RepID=UPI001BDF563E|nr:neutral/alkaline non-lysosomal ceramidase N-terminal domain-containing protein [Flavihumibacter fluvii]ULQ52114.1 neutral/alkaline non-lysosomal ceramidase N-terminal domain-containing protein [Flavihumibacter fluvii]